MNLLVALDMPASQDFVSALESIWDSGDAVLPIDQRLPEHARRKLAGQFNASAVIEGDNSKTKLSGGIPVEQGDALVIATSGSTGEPKGVIHTHGSIDAAVLTTGGRLNCSKHDHWLACLSLAHVGGLSVVIRALHFGSSLTVGNRADQKTILAALDKGATMTSLVPTVLKSVDISKFRTVLIGGSHAPDELPSNAISTYGLTETMGGVVYDGVPLDGVEVRIADDSEILIRSRTALRCYRDGTNTTTQDGWLPTGDLGEMTDGMLSVHGRRDELINTGGYKVWPNLVENSINNIDGVADCVVRGLTDEKWGSVVSAWIVLADPKVRLNLADVRKHIKQSLPDYCAPNKLFIIDEIPRSTLGKVQVSELLKLKTF